MQTRRESGVLWNRRCNRWLLYSLIALPTLAGQALAQTAAGAAAKTTYGVIQLSAGAYDHAKINARGQVAFDEYHGGNRTGAKFYDGSTLRDLGTLGGPSSSVSGFNDMGQVTGSATIDADGQVDHAYVWSQATGMVDLSRGGDEQTYGVDINNKGQLVGRYFSPTTDGKGGFLWSPRSGWVDLGAIEPVAINGAGTVIGTWNALVYDTHLLRWTRAEGIRDLGANTGEYTGVSYINSAGHIVGTNQMPGFLWTPRAGMLALPSGSGGGGLPLKVNDHDLVVGFNFWGTDCIYPCNGFIWSREVGFIEIGRASDPTWKYTSASDVNNRGQVVGSVDDHAYLWTRRAGFVDLNSVAAGMPDGLKLLDGVGISNNGSILADSNTGLVLLVPNGAQAAQAPVVGPLNLPDDPRTDVPQSFSAAFKDVDVRDTHTATWVWGDGSTDSGTVSENHGTGSVSDQHTYHSAGYFSARLTITDSSGKSTSVEEGFYVDASGAHVTGRGRFMSPPGASKRAPKLGGIGTFAILSGAQNGAGVAQGTAGIVFNAAGIHLRSAQIDSLSIHDDKLQYTGTGKVNGKSGYHFALTAIRANGLAGGKDRIRMRIWHDGADSKNQVVDYDNGSDSPALSAGGKGAAVVEGGISLKSS